MTSNLGIELHLGPGLLGFFFGMEPAGFWTRTLYRFFGLYIWTEPMLDSLVFPD